MNLYTYDGFLAEVEPLTLYEPSLCSSVDSVQDMRTAGRWFDSWLVQHIFSEN